MYRVKLIIFQISLFSFFPVNAKSESQLSIKNAVIKKCPHWIRALHAQHSLSVLKSSHDRLLGNKKAVESGPIELLRQFRVHLQLFVMGIPDLISNNQTALVANYHLRNSIQELKREINLLQGILIGMEKWPPKKKQAVLEEFVRVQDVFSEMVVNAGANSLANLEIGWNSEGAVEPVIQKLVSRLENFETNLGNLIQDPRLPPRKR